jgi:transmembrane sensor
MALSRITYLVQQVIESRATEEEWKEFHQLVLQSRQQPELHETLLKNWQSFNPAETLPAEELTDIYAAIMQNPGREAVVRKMPLWYKWVAAAAVLIILTGGIYLWLGRSTPAGIVKVTHLPAGNIGPGGNKAVLTLGDGRKIVLDSAANGMLAREGGGRVVKSANGEIIYEPGSNQPAKELVYNTMTTPRGGQYHLVLPDGSGVWLNAASSITYPVRFAGKERKVAITGEAYFEVAKNASLPFRVTINDGAEVEVLGTHFNINAYQDEDDIKTTLLEGSVKVTSDFRLPTSNFRLLSPGQQAQVKGAEQPIKVLSDVNTEQVVAWKNGLFDFKGADLPTVLRQLERWYDIQVKYQGKIPSYAFQGKLQRNLNLSQLLRVLDEMEVNYSIEGKTLTVKP